MVKNIFHYQTLKKIRRVQLLEKVTRSANLSSHVYVHCSCKLLLPKANWFISVQSDLTVINFI